MAAPGGRGGSAAAAEEEGCDLFQCFCKWRKRCSPRIPRVSPGRDYVCISSNASGDTTPKWSVLVGCTSADEPFHNLRTHRFRVSDSGRVMGCSDDMLERFRGVSPDDDEHTVFSSATAAMAPNGRSMCIICAHSPSFDQRSTGTGTGGGGGGEQDIGLLRKAFLMDCVDKSLTALPPIPFPRGSYQSVWAHGELWTPATVEDPGPSGVKRRLLVYRLDGASNSWAKISDIDFPYRRPPVNIFCGGPLLQGYAVIRDRFIFMSFIDLSFFCFDCASSTLTRVTTEDETIQYVPIRGRAAHVADNDNGIYFIERGTLFRYNYSLEGDKPLKPPEVIDAICPYRKEGYGFVLHLRNGMLCAVWMNMNMPCKCARRHVLITTFRVECQLDKDGFEPKVLEVLHSTCRRIGMLRSKAPGHESYDRLCFIQEYLDDSPEIDPSIASMMGARSSHPEADEVDPKILFCCREFLSRRELRSCVVLEECRVMVKSEFRFICQSGQHTFVYKISTARGKLTCHETILEAELSLETIRNGDVGIDDLPAWHFVNYGMKLYVIPSIPQYNHYEVDVHRNSSLILESKRPSICFSAVCRVGQRIVALGDTLEAVYILDQQNMEWVFCKTSSRSLDLRKKIMISGFVDLGDDSVMISEVDACECFMLDLKKGQWFVVEPPYGDIWQYCVGLLSGTCMFIEGFIYTCSDGEMVAYELIEKDGLCHWDAPVILKLPWKMFSNRKFMAFSPICKDVIHDDIAFSIVEARPFGSSHTVAITIVQVKLQETTRGTKRPVEIDHVDISMSSIEQNGWILSNYAFTL